MTAPIDRASGTLVPRETITDVERSRQPPRSSIDWPQNPKFRLRYLSVSQDDQGRRTRRRQPFPHTAGLLADARPARRHAPPGAARLRTIANIEDAANRWP